MRTRTLVVIAVLASAVAITAACTSAPMVSVYRLGIGDKSEGLQGDPVRTRRPSEETSFAGAGRGYWVVKSTEDWNRVWPEGQVPPFPRSLDTSTSMAFVVVPDSRDAVDVKITKVVESTGFIHVWVRESMRGEACMAHASDKVPVEALYAPRIEKPVKFYIEETRAESCGDPPITQVKCRKAEDKEWATKLEVQPGELIDCELLSEARGKFAVVDRAIFFSDLPGGSTAKLAYQKGPSRATFRADAFGTYGLRGEATDESGRKASAKIEVTATPPKTKDALVQLVWTNFDSGDDPDTFPRLTLTAMAGTGPSARECSLDRQPPELCEVRRFSAYTMMKLKASSEKLPLSVRYVDERVEKGPLACIHVWFEGARTAEVCDRVHRDPDQRWEVGVLDMTTGKLGDPLPAGPADAGAEAGAKKPAVKPPAK